MSIEHSTRDPGRAGESQGEQSYSEAVDILDAAIVFLDHPSKGIGYSPGLRRGDGGYMIAVEARDKLRRLRDHLMREESRS